MPRHPLYASNAERQAAYRARVAERQRLAGTEAGAGRIAELERALAAAERRAGRAEQLLEDRAGGGELPSGDRSGWGWQTRQRHHDRTRLANALLRIEGLESVVDQLRRQLDQQGTSPPPPTGVVTRANRAARRQAERQQRRR